MRNQTVMGVDEVKTNCSICDVLLVDIYVFTVDKDDLSRILGYGTVFFIFHIN